MRASSSSIAACDAAPGPPAAARRARKPRVVSGAFEAGAGAALLLTPSAAAEANEHVIMRLSVRGHDSPPQETVTTPPPVAPPADVLGAYNAASAEPFASHPLVLAAAAGPSSGLYGAEAPPLSVGAVTMLTPAEDGAGAAGTLPHPLARSSATGMRVTQLLAEFRKKTDAGEWPQSTSVHCHWCCHPFCTVPIGLPVRATADKFHATGCFCSFECAAAHNFASRESPDEVLHRHSLLVALARRSGAGTRVVAAPARETLLIFGGALDIERFRAQAGSGRVTLVNVPPLQAVTQQAEEVHETDLRGEYKHIPIDTERVTRIQERTRLRRTKPLIDVRYTLDSTMGLKITGTTSTTVQHFPPLGS